MTQLTTPTRPDATSLPAQPLPVRVLQFGGGNFLRAFVDQMIQRSNDAGVTELGVTIVHATAHPDRALDLLEEQDGRYHVLLEGIRDGLPVRDVTPVTAVQSIVRSHEDFDAYRAAYLSPDLRVVVSNTTEAGIAWVPGDDLDARPPVSFPAKITALLHDRFLEYAGAPEAGLAFVCCELIEDNATTLREYVLRHAQEAGLGTEFIDWVRTANTFHDTLVDRIVPGFPREEIDELQAEIGFADQVLVKGEYFGVWAIGGDDVVRELLPLDRAGLPVEFMTDIRPFRARKVRILNGLHTAMTQVGLLLGLDSVREADADPDVAAYLGALLQEEILPSIPGDPAELRAFAAKIVERFANPYLHHRLADISLNSLSKYQARNLPVLLDAWAAGREAPASSFALAALLLLDSGRVDAAGWTPVDDEALLAFVRETYDAEDLLGWVGGVLVRAGYLEPEDPRLARLAQDVATQAGSILRLGPRAALNDLRRA